MSSILISSGPVMTLWATVVAKRLGHPADTALTLGYALARAVAKARTRNVIQELKNADQEGEIRQLAGQQAAASVLLLGKMVLLQRGQDCKLQAVDGDRATDPVAVEHYLAKAFGGQLDEIQTAMTELANKYKPADLNRIGFHLYNKFRPKIPLGTAGWTARAKLETGRIRGANYTP